MVSYDHLRPTNCVVTDYFEWRRKTKRTTNNVHLFNIVRKIGYHCEKLYYSGDIKFNVQCSLSMLNLKTIHDEIGKELFDDGKVSWSRIITLISFSAILAEKVIEKKKEEDIDMIISSLIEWTTSFIDINLGTWLEHENYWVGCVKHYDKSAEKENGKSIYDNVVGVLGMLAMGVMYMVRR